jgi:mannose/fructose/N-acetylgalactosamine-specific phosphotransferase system component IIC
MDVVSLLLVALAGGVLALDATSVGQFMISRPLVVGAVAGWILGDPVQGLFLGALLELYLLVSFPVGGARFPEGATATVVAVGSAAGVPSVGAVPIAIAAGLVWGHFGGWTITGLRRLNGHLIAESDRAFVDSRFVVLSHLSALLLDFVRGFLITIVGVLAGRTAVIMGAPAWPLSARDSIGLLLVGAAVSCGILLRSLGGFRRRKVLFAAGLALGLLWVRYL